MKRYPATSRAPLLPLLLVQTLVVSAHLDVVDILLRVFGAFYVFAGYVAARAALTSHVLDQAVAGVSSEKPPRIEVAQTYWMLASSMLIFVGGVALVLLIDIAAPLYALSAAGMVLYLAYLAPKFFDPADPPTPSGRQQTKNATVLYLLITSIVLWAATAGKLQPWQDVPKPLLSGAVAAVAAHAIYVLKGLLWRA
jgi:hypothetical protein